MIQQLDTLSMMRALIGTPSVSSTNPRFDQSNLPVIHLLAEWLEGLNFDVEIIPLPEQPEKANLIATLGPKHKEADGLVLSGHTDTVPYDDTNWLHDPFSLTDKDNQFYGLGSTDMKSFFAMAIHAIASLDTTQLKRPIVILATADEESAMSGAQALKKAQLEHAKYAIIGEPTSIAPIRMHKGVMMESISITGKSGHSSNPGLGASATEGMFKVIQELLTWREQLQKTHTHSAFEINVPTLNIGAIHGGDNPNRICAHCETQIDIRPLPGMNINDLRNDLQRRLSNILKDDQELSLTYKPFFNGVPPFETPQQAYLTQLTEKLSGQASQAVAFGTEAPYLNQLGLETIVIGPGSIDQAHQPNEFVSHLQVSQYCNFLQKLITEICIK